MLKWGLRIILAMAVGFCLFCALYYVKNRLPFELSTRISIHQYFPFKYLVRKDTFELSRPGPVMSEDFEGWVYFSRWYHLWAKEGERVDLHSEENGFSGSNALRVISRSKEGWVVSPPVFIAVEPGTQVVFEAMLYRDFATQEAGLRLSGFDNAKIELNSKLTVADMAGAPGGWEKVSLVYIVPKGIAYVRPRIRGKGIGRVKLDNILVSRD